ncbi:hypothetical protein D3C78_1972130 [compost metagenome]
MLAVLAKQPVRRVRRVKSVGTHVHHAVARVVEIRLAVQVPHLERTEPRIIRQGQQRLMEIDSASVAKEVIA